MSKTPCEKLGYKVGDKFVVVCETERSAVEVGDVLELSADDGSDHPWFINVDNVTLRCPGLKCVAKLEGEGWIGWKGGEMPVETGTLMDVMFRCELVSFGVSAGLSPHGEDFICHNGCWSAYSWSHVGSPADIVAYRLHKEEKPELEQAAPTLDDLMQAWRKAKANSDHSRHMLKMAEQDEVAARKALDDALRAAGLGEAAKDEPLNITDWRDLKPGDIVWWGCRNFPSGECVVKAVMRKEYTGSFAFSIQAIVCSRWVDTHHDQWRFIRRPA